MTVKEREVEDPNQVAAGEKKKREGEDEEGEKETASIIITKSHSWAPVGKHIQFNPIASFCSVGLNVHQASSS